MWFNGSRVPLPVKAGVIQKRSLRGRQALFAIILHKMSNPGCNGWKDMVYYKKQGAERAGNAPKRSPAEGAQGA